jgi:hypothetical protein
MEYKELMGKHSSSSRRRSKDGSQYELIQSGKAVAIMLGSRSSAVDVCDMLEHD